MNRELARKNAVAGSHLPLHFHILNKAHWTLSNDCWRLSEANRSSFGPS